MTLFLREYSAFEVCWSLKSRTTTSQFGFGPMTGFHLLSPLLGLLQGWSTSSFLCCFTVDILQNVLSGLEEGRIELFLENRAFDLEDVDDIALLIAHKQTL